MNVLTDKEWIEINNIVRELYSCEDMETLGDTFLSLIRKMIPFRMGSFAVLNDDLSVKKEQASTLGEMVISVEEYNEKCLQFDFTNDVMSYPKSVVFRDCDIVDDGEKVNTVFYKNFMAPYGAEFYSGVLIKHNKEMLACITFLRTRLHGQLGEKDVFILEAFIGHLENILNKMMKENIEQQMDFSRISEYKLLTKREREILKYIVNGDTNGEISDKLFITESTVKKHVYNIFMKFKVCNRYELRRKCEDK